MQPGASQPRQLRLYASLLASQGPRSHLSLSLLPVYAFSHSYYEGRLYLATTGRAQHLSSARRTSAL